MKKRILKKKKKKKGKEKTVHFMVNRKSIFFIFNAL